MRAGERALATLAASILIYDLAAGDDEQITSAIRRLDKLAPIATRTTILTTALHCLGALPAIADPFKGIRAVRKLIANLTTAAN